MHSGNARTDGVLMSPRHPGKDTSLRLFKVVCISGYFTFVFCSKLNTAIISPD